MGNPKGSCRSRVVKSVNGFIAFSSVSCHSSEVRRGRKGQKQFLKGSSMGNCWRLIILGYFNNNWTIVIFLKSKDEALMVTRSVQFTFCLVGRRYYRLTFLTFLRFPLGVGTKAQSCGSRIWLLSWSDFCMIFISVSQNILSKVESIFGIGFPC